MKKIASLVVASVIALSSSATVFAKDGYQVKRIYGTDRYKTSFNIANEFSSDKVNNVIIASGKDFPDALTGSVLSQKLNAPIVLSNNTLSESSDCINYIKNHMDKDGTIYVLGGTASVSSEFIAYMNKLGYNNIVRLGGQDRFHTNKVIVDNMKIEKGTPVVIANGYGFADALSISSIAAVKGYPILMTDGNGLSNYMKEEITNISPSKVYIIGGQGSVKDNVVNEIKALTPSLSDDNIVRIGGQNRYETSLKISQYFDLNTDTAVVASGENFPDALSGSALAAKLKAPILLTNGKDISVQQQYLDSKGYNNISILGGTGAVDLTVEYSLKGKLASDQEKTSIESLATYYENYINKNIEVTNNIASMSTKINGYYNDIVQGQDVNTMKNSFSEFINLYEEGRVFLVKYKEDITGLRDEMSNLQVEEEFKPFKDKYITYANNEISNIDKYINFMNTYIDWSRSVLDAINSEDVDKLNEQMSKTDQLLSGAKDVQNLGHTQVDMAKIGIDIGKIRSYIK